MFEDMALGVHFTFWKVAIYPHNCVYVAMKKNCVKTCVIGKEEKSLHVKLWLDGFTCKGGCLAADS